VLEIGLALVEVLNRKELRIRDSGCRARVGAVAAASERPLSMLVRRELMMLLWKKI
jgi:hypothetical protein